jgi:hypothetical protein
MTKIEKIVREFNDLNEFYNKIQKLLQVNKNATAKNIHPRIRQAD